MDSVPAARVGAVELAPALATGRFSGLWNREGFCAARRVPCHRRPVRAVLRPRDANWYTMWGALYATRRQGARGDEDRPSSHASENAANAADPPATVPVRARYRDLTTIRARPASRSPGPTGPHRCASWPPPPG